MRLAGNGRRSRLLLVVTVNESVEPVRTARVEVWRRVMTCSSSSSYILHHGDRYVVRARLRLGARARN